MNQKQLKAELEHFRKTGIPRCFTCKKNFKKVEKESGKLHEVWEKDCDCSKNKRQVRLCIG